MLKFRPMFTKSIAILALTGVVALSSLGAALADSPAQDGKPKQGVFGSVTAKSGNAFTVKTNQGSTVELAVTGDTQFRAPGKAEASFSNLAVGSRVAILTEGEGASQSALKVMLVPGEPQREHRVLTVTEVSGRTVVAEDAQGNRIEVELDRETSADIKGQLVTFIGARSQQSNRFKANVEVKIGQVVNRLEAQAKKLEVEAKAETNAKAKAEKEKNLAELKARLEANMQRHLDLFAEIIAKAPVQARASLEAALQLSLNGYKTALEALGDSRPNVEVRLQLRTLHGSVEAIHPSTVGAASGAPTGQTPQANEITVKSRGDANVTLKVTGDTRILIGEKTGNLSNISIGDQVTVRYNSRTSVATEIRVKTETEARGTIQSVDTAKGQLVIVLSTGATLTLKLTPDTRIEVNHKKATAADLKANAAVEVEFNLKTMETREVEASTRAEVRGTVKAVDSASGTVTILTQDGKEVKVKVTNATRVDIQGLLFGILGISPGMAIKAEFDLTTGEAAELKARAEGRGRGEVGPQEKAHGSIASIDAASGKITVNLDSGGTLTVRATGDTMIELNGRRIALAGLETGARVKVEFDATTQIASEVEARSKPQAQLEAEAHGTIQALDAAKHKVTIRLRDGSTKELTISGDTTIRISGQPSAEADLKPGMELEVRFRTDTGAALRINTTAQVQAQAEIRGKVKSVNVAVNQLVVETRDGKTVVVSIASTTRIIRAGQSLALQVLTPGAEVKIQLQTGVSGNVAETIEVLGRPGASLRPAQDTASEVRSAGQAQASLNPSTQVESSASSDVRGSGQAQASASPNIRAESSVAVQTH